jgi:hypothetical protein
VAGRLTAGDFESWYSTDQFDQAIAELVPVGERVTIAADRFDTEIDIHDH